MSINSSLPREFFKLTDIPDASESIKGLVKLSNDITSTNTTDAATPKALKEVYDEIKQISSSVTKSIVTINGVNGTTFTITNGSETVEGSIGDSGSTIVELAEIGEFTATGTIQGKSMTYTYNIDYIGIYNFDLYVSISFNDDTYEFISSMIKKGLASSLYALGDAKEVVLNGTVGTGITFSNTVSYMFIAAFDHNKDLEMNGESHIVCSFGKSALTGGVDVCFVDSKYDSSDKSLQYFNMHTSNTNAGGWKSSTMRSKLCPAFKSALPSDLQAVLRSRTIYTDNSSGSLNNSSSITTTSDTVYIPSQFEISGSSDSYEKNYQQQLQYYANGNSKNRYKHNSTSTVAYWWLRTRNYGDTGCYYCVSNNNFSISYSHKIYGFAPLITI